MDDDPPDVSDDAHADAIWHLVPEYAELPEGRVRTAVVDGRSICITRYDGRVGALGNRCPHQGGPLGEGSIENGLLRCPWHGYDYDPITGVAPGSFGDSPTRTRSGGPTTASRWPCRPVRAHRRTVSDVMVETMVAWGVTHVFGMVGHSNLGFADAMRRAEERGELTFIGIRHEGAAAFAASAFGKLTGRPGVCFAIAGPGSTNLLTGLYDAKVDRAPVVAVSGQVPSKVLGRGAFQDLDLPAAFADVATWASTVLPASDHAELMTLAFKPAIVERGVAHLVLPDEVQVLPRPRSRPGRRPGGSPTLRSRPPVAALDAATDLVATARTSGVRRRPRGQIGIDGVVALAEQLGAPVLTTFKAKGLVADDHPLGSRRPGTVGNAGGVVADERVRPPRRVGRELLEPHGHRPVQADRADRRDPIAIGRFHPVTVGVLGDVGVTAACSPAVSTIRSRRPDQRADVAARQALWRAEKRRRLARTTVASA